MIQFSDSGELILSVLLYSTSSKQDFFIEIEDNFNINFQNIPIFLKKIIFFIKVNNLFNRINDL